MSADENNESPNTRWWESYLVRYFLGFIVGTLCMIAIIGLIFPKQAPSIIGDAAGFFQDQPLVKIPANSNSAPHNAQSPEAPFATASAIGIALLGLAFCYIASTPITVIHAARMYRTWWERQTRTFWLGWSATLGLCAAGVGDKLSTPWAVIFLLAGFAILMLVDPFYFCSSRKLKFPESHCKFETPKLWQSFDSTPPEKSEENTHRLGRTFWGFLVNSTAWTLLQVGICACISTGLGDNKSIPPIAFAFTLPTIWICLVQYNCLIQILTHPATFSEWYRRISKARIQTGSRDIRETYTHLREHANSVFIVVIELSIFSLLLVASQLSPQSQPGVIHSIEFKYLSAAFLGIWLTPTIFMWSRANWLEQEFADHPEHFKVPSSTPASDTGKGH